MQSMKVRGLVLACGCLLTVAAVGCGSTADVTDTSGDTSGLRGGQVQGASGDTDKDVDEVADEAAKGAAGGAVGAAGGAATDPRDGKRRPGVDDDADGGVDVRDCRGRGFIGWHERDTRGSGSASRASGGAPNGGGKAGDGGSAPRGNGSSAGAGGSKGRN